MFSRIRECIEWVLEGTGYPPIEEWQRLWESLAGCPQDLFGLMSVLAECTGAYAHQSVVPAKALTALVEVWPRGELNERWHRLSAALDSRPDEVVSGIKRAIIELYCAADERYSYKELNEDRFWSELFLESRGTLSQKIDPARVRILPKYRTPQVGLTLRSWSHHLAAIRSECPIVYGKAGLWGKQLDSHSSISMVLFPWPRQVEATDFGAEPKNKHGYFKFEPSVPLDLNLMKRALERAAELGPISLAMFPEAALSESEFTAAWDLARESSCSLLAGVRGENSNQVWYADTFMLAPDVFRKQTKHHRWRLDERQIRTYKLGGRLTPHLAWWEKIDVDDKSLLVIDADMFSMVPLVCEDLARQEPLAPIVRALGPSLVVALLLDGPQLRQRWSARYATVLAEDPGSSVLCLTCVGMVDRSEPPPGVRPSRAVALWHSPDQAAPQEIELPAHASALRITVGKRPRREVSADGRLGSPQSGTLYLADVTPIFY